MLLCGINFKNTSDHFFFLQGIILVYDITRQETFNNIRKWLRYVDEVSAGRLFPIFHCWQQIHANSSYILKVKPVAINNFQ